MGNGLINEAKGKTYLRGRTLGSSVTNADPNSCKTCTVTCEDQWSIVQFKALKLLSENGRLVSNVLARAKRTAGNYAALFLEDEGKPTQGRFYWPGLAAFAAKQVVEGIDYADKNIESLVGQVRLMAGLSLYYLLKGNFWVFVEVTPWKLFYRDYGHKLFFHCLERRNVATYDPQAQPIMNALPWAKGANEPLRQAIQKRLGVLNIADMQWSRLKVQDDKGALAEMNGLRATHYLKSGFKLLREYESTSASSDASMNKYRAQLAYNSASAFLNHEQTLHLQAMIYDHADFQFAWDNNDLGRQVNSWLPITGARDPNLVFHHKPEITKLEETNDLKPAGLTKEQVSVAMALDDGKLYDSADRMRYVERILQRYHRLMGSYREYMISQLGTIADWKDVS